MVRSAAASVPNNLEAFWMPYTANRQFKKNPRMFVGAEGMYYTTADGRKVLDGTAGLWCVNAGHKRPRIVEAIQRQVEELDYAPAFQMGHPKAFELAARLVNMAPKGLDHVMFANSGSEAVETALKVAIAYHRAKGDGSRFRLIGRVRGYHGVNFGGMSVGGIVPNRKMFGTLLTGVDHLPHTHDLARNAFTRGQPEYGVELADELEKLVQLHDASTIAAVIVEPVAGSTGVLIPPKGYLERLREITAKHGILLIFDEVITGFARTGEPFAAQTYGVQPDIVTMAKALTNGSIPMGAVGVSDAIYKTIVDSAPEKGVEFFHGYTYTSHPAACAAGLASLDIYEKEGLFERAKAISPGFLDRMFALRDLPAVADIRGVGTLGAIELAPDGAPGTRGYQAVMDLYEKGVLTKVTGDTIMLAPAFICTDDDFDRMFAILRGVIAGY